MKHTNKYITAYFMDDDELLSCIKKLNESKVKILDVLTPFPIHGLDSLIGLKRSRIPLVGLIAGLAGGIFALLSQIWISTTVWPLDIGGKPFLAIPSFVPVTFEISVLAAAFGMFGAYLFKSKLKPVSKNIIQDERITDDRFLIIVDLGTENIDENEAGISQLLKETGALGITTKGN